MFFTKNEYLSPIELSDVEINEVIEVISDKYKVVQENNHIYSSIAVIYDIVDENGDYRDAGSVEVSNEKIEIKLYENNKKIILHRDKTNIEQKLEERLIEIKSGNYWGIEYQKYKVNEEEYSSAINKYLTTSIMLNNHYTSIKTAQFNKVLEKMNFIKKVQNYNNSKWILLEDGLKYGINSQKRHVEYNTIEIPDWYVISKFDYHTKEYQIDESRYQTYTTEILWNKEEFQDLLDLIVAYPEPKEKIVSEKKIEREEWLQFVECPHCASKNIHKKNKRTYGYGEVQRYQCMDCKKIFQKVLSSE